jgi:hypothetical protein
VHDQELEDAIERELANAPELTQEDIEFMTNLFASKLSQ